MLASTALIQREVVLPWTGRAYAITMPDDIDSLLDLVADDPEQNLPYWAELWPSGLALADLIEQSPELVRGQRVLELGCGLGLTAIAALGAGAALTVSDYALAAIELCRHNCETNAGALPEAMTMNWRNVAETRAAVGDRRFPVLLAADVLYERRDIVPLLVLVDELIEPGGAFWLAEPGRPVAAEFLALAAARGWRRRSRQHLGPWPDAADAGVVVGLHELRPPD
jgi:predicted nicotinamide N-methyase